MQRHTQEEQEERSSPHGWTPPTPDHAAPPAMAHVPVAQLRARWDRRQRTARVGTTLAACVVALAGSLVGLLVARTLTPPFPVPPPPTTSSASYTLGKTQYEPMIPPPGFFEDMFSQVQRDPTMGYMVRVEGAVTTYVGPTGDFSALKNMLAAELEKLPAKYDPGPPIRRSYNIKLAGHGMAVGTTLSETPEGEKWLAPSSEANLRREAVQSLDTLLISLAQSQGTPGAGR